MCNAGQRASLEGCEHRIPGRLPCTGPPAAVKTGERPASQSRPGVKGAIAALDGAALQRVAENDSRLLDLVMPRLSRLANHGLLWTGLAIGLWVTGDRWARRAAWRGIGGLAAASAAANVAVKAVAARDRPDAHVPAFRQLQRVPRTTSFPSGHAASGFAFAAAIGRDQPWLGLALRFLAAAVAYSRVHTGVHYPGDAVVGALIGEGTGQAVAGLIDRLPRAGQASRSGRGMQHELPDAADPEDTPDAGTG